MCMHVHTHNYMHVLKERQHLPVLWTVGNHLILHGRIIKIRCVSKKSDMMVRHFYREHTGERE